MTRHRLRVPRLVLALMSASMFAAGQPPVPTTLAVWSFEHDLDGWRDDGVGDHLGVWVVALAVQTSTADPRDGWSWDRFGSATPGAVQALRSTSIEGQHHAFLWSPTAQLPRGDRTGRLRLELRYRWLGAGTDEVRVDLRVGGKIAVSHVLARPATPSTWTSLILELPADHPDLETATYAAVLMKSHFQPPDPRAECGVGTRGRTCPTGFSFDDVRLSWVP